MKSLLIIEHLLENSMTLLTILFYEKFQSSTHNIITRKISLIVVYSFQKYSINILFDDD